MNVQSMLPHSSASEYSLRRPLLAHPTTVFFVVWAMTLALAACGWIPIFAQYASTAVLVGVLLITSNLLGAAFASITVRQPRRPHKGCLRYRGRALIFRVWVVISLVEIGFAGGLPVIWLLTGSGRTYEDFGIHTVHGLANGLWIFLAFTQCLRIFDRACRRRDRQLALALLVWPILMMSRALITILLLQVVSFYLITTMRRMRSVLLRLSVLVVIFALAFGYMGDVRAPDFSIVEALGFDSDQTRSTALLWIYSYIVSPVSTLALNWEISIPEFTLLPFNTLANLLPSVARSALSMGTGFDSYIGVLAHDAFNVSTAFLAPFLDWGPAGMLVMAFVIGFIGHVVWCAALRNALKLPLLSAYDAFVALTIFTNQFTQLMPLLLLVMLTYLARRPRVRRVETRVQPTPSLS